MEPEYREEREKCESCGQEIKRKINLVRLNEQDKATWRGMKKMDNMLMAIALLFLFVWLVLPTVACVFELKSLFVWLAKIRNWPPLSFITLGTIIAWIYNGVRIQINKEKILKGYGVNKNDDYETL